MKFIESPYWQSRNGKKIDGIVIHTMVGTYDGTIKYFQNNDRSVSAHYLVSLTGDVTQMVDEKLGANHAGIISNPKTPVYKGFNPNWNTIGIENADDGKPATADRTNQIPALVALVKDICQRNGIPIDRDHICGHRELYDKKTCPGNISVEEVVKLASGLNEDVITDQTKIPQIENKEVQQIKSELLAKDSEITSLRLTVASLNNQITALSTPQATTLPQDNNVVPTDSKNSLIAKLISWLIGLLTPKK